PEGRDGKSRGLSPVFVPPVVPLYVDTDNALGSRRGDVDDGFALLALAKSEIPVAAIGSIFGNTSAAEAADNTRRLLQRRDAKIVVRQRARHPTDESNGATDFLVPYSDRLRLVALGPLTNIAFALRREPHLAKRIDELVIVGGRRRTWGRWPPVWP